ncbi:hypothetical protein [Mycobacterium sp. E1386]|uniref:hypothetical protein n=1 Tax=Mycobacterium sp. E1386 TaxID=1834126 RepID=UPI000A5C141D|nr:hypothetical protein [Mycobacterium sp. E1386]
MRTEQDKLVWRLKSAMGAIAPEQLAVGELCRLVPTIEGAADREVEPVDNVITFAACRRRRARRVASRKQSGGDD